MAAEARHLLAEEAQARRRGRVARGCTRDRAPRTPLDRAQTRARGSRPRGTRPVARGRRSGKSPRRSSSSSAGPRVSACRAPAARRIVRAGRGHRFDEPILERSQRGALRQRGSALRVVFGSAVVTRIVGLRRRRRARALVHERLGRSSELRRRPPVAHGRPLHELTRAAAPRRASLRSSGSPRPTRGAPTLRRARCVRLAEQAPHRIDHRADVRVDDVRAVVGVPGDVKLHDAIEGDGVEVGRRVEAVVVRGDVDVVHVEQDPAVGLLGEAREKLPLVHRRAGELDVRRRVLERDRRAEEVLHRAHAARDVAERLLGVRHRQEVVRVLLRHARPAKVVGHPARARASRSARSSAR